MSHVPARGPVVAQRCDRFVARTMNWMYDHLRHLPRHEPIVFCDELENRREFPELMALDVSGRSLVQRAWRRIRGAERACLAVQRMRRYSPRALHSHFGYVAAGDGELSKRLGIPWLVAFYGADVYQLGRLDEWRRTYAEIFHDCERVLALGPQMAQSLSALGCPAAKIIVHPLGVAVDELPSVSRRWKESDGPLKVLFAGTFREKKGVPYALRGVAEARDAGVPLQLHLVCEAATKPGDREAEAEAVRLIGELDLQNRIVRHSFLTFCALIDLALDCHVFLCPSVTASDGDSEGTPFVLQQMMATAMPVVATHHSDIPYVFGDLRHLLVAERDSHGIAAKLVEYAQRPDLLGDHGRLLRQQVSQHFDVRKCAAQLSEIYAELLRN